MGRYLGTPGTFTVTRGTVTMLDSEEMKTVTVPAFDTTKAVLHASWLNQGGGASVQNAIMSWQISNSTTLTFYGDPTNGDLIIQWQLQVSS